ncbi:hypothetical protein AVEN_196367-1 [Araneus ventricosus]|uniref:Uncharacterized protein n=1 Tax=Araneus ventricosus TaxID=182803 RepID=A0A4Y2AU04_ARAVE|nr:hypothetical protein AVEN_196367-1 [Araneus ventricosus]
MTVSCQNRSSLWKLRRTGVVWCARLDIHDLSTSKPVVNMETGQNCVAWSVKIHIHDSSPPKPIVNMETIYNWNGVVRRAGHSRPLHVQTSCQCGNWSELCGVETPRQNRSSMWKLVRTGMVWFVRLDIHDPSTSKPVVNVETGQNCVAWSVKIHIHDSSPPKPIVNMETI